MASLWEERREDRRKMDEHFAELQHAIVQLKDENAEFQMESHHDKEVWSMGNIYELIW